MGVTSFEELMNHLGYDIEIVMYGNPPINVAIECLTCNEVLIDFDKEDSDG